MTPEVLERLRIQSPATGPGTLPVVVRRPDPSDMPLVFDTWQKSVRTARAYSQIPNEVFSFWYHLLVEGVWVDTTMGWVIACSPENPDQVYGWLCGQRADTLSGDVALVHYVYVKKSYRRFGLASRLLATFDTRKDQEGSPLVVTHLTDSGKELLAATEYNYLYNPFLFLGRAPVPRPELAQRGQRTRNDPAVVARRNAVAGGFRPGLADPETDPSRKEHV